MSEEAAFLEALKANPADDTTRLVYADWLDEHGEPQKAEYLRLVVAYAQLDGDCIQLSGKKRRRFITLAATLSDEWRMTAGARFALILDTWANKLRVMRWFREVTGDDLGDAQAACESLPHALFHHIPLDVALSACERIRGDESVTAHITRSPQDAASESELFDLCAFAEVYGPLDVRAPEQHPCEVLAGMLMALGVPEAEANRRAVVRTVIVLATGLTVQESRERCLALSRFGPRFGAGWNLRITRCASTPISRE